LKNKKLENERFLSIDFLYAFVVTEGADEGKGEGVLGFMTKTGMSPMIGKIALRMAHKMEEYKKFGTVFKKGRDISLIDPLIIFNTDMIHKLREEYYKSR